MGHGVTEVDTHSVEVANVIFCYSAVIQLSSLHDNVYTQALLID